MNNQKITTEHTPQVPVRFHEYANLFPMLEGDALEALKQDIRVHGVREPIVFLDGAILDGRNRYMCARELGIEYPRREFGTSETDGSEPAAYVASHNLHRRHLNASQRAMVAAKLAKLPAHRPEKGANLHPSASDAAELLSVSERSVKTAKKVERQGAAELVEAVEQGRVSVSAAADLAKLPKPEQAEVVARGEKEILEAAKRIRAEKARARREQNAVLETVAPPPPTGQYSVIVIDPPWPMKKIERDVRPNQVEFDYPTMTEGELADLHIPAAEDCHVWLWTTHKFMPMAFRLLDAWGLRYVCTFTWHKPGGFQPIGLPQYNCEFALYARKGSPTFSDTKAFPTCFDAPRGAHSEKPEKFYETLRRVTTGPRLDMFNRRPIDGFTGWGNESVELAS